MQFPVNLNKAGGVGLELMDISSETPIKKTLQGKMKISHDYCLAVCKETNKLFGCRIRDFHDPSKYIFVGGNSHKHKTIQEFVDSAIMNETLPISVLHNSIKDFSRENIDRVLLALSSNKLGELMVYTASGHNLPNFPMEQLSDWMANKLSQNPRVVGVMLKAAEGEFRKAFIARTDVKKTFIITAINSLNKQSKLELICSLTNDEKRTLFSISSPVFKVNGDQTCNDEDMISLALPIGIEEKDLPKLDLSVVNASTVEVNIVELDVYKLIAENTDVSQVIGFLNDWTDESALVLLNEVDVACCAQFLKELPQAKASSLFMKMCSGQFEYSFIEESLEQSNSVKESGTEAVGSTNDTASDAGLIESKELSDDFCSLSVKPSRAARVLRYMDGVQFELDTNLLTTRELHVLITDLHNTNKALCDDLIMQLIENDIEKLINLVKISGSLIIRLLNDRQLATLVAAHESDKDFMGQLEPYINENPERTEGFGKILFTSNCTSFVNLASQVNENALIALTASLSSEEKAQLTFSIPQERVSELIFCGNSSENLIELCKSKNLKEATLLYIFYMYLNTGGSVQTVAQACCAIESESTLISLLNSFQLDKGNADFVNLFIELVKQDPALSLVALLRMDKSHKRVLLDSSQFSGKILIEIGKKVNIKEFLTLIKAFPSVNGGKIINIILAYTTAKESEVCSFFAQTQEVENIKLLAKFGAQYLAKIFNIAELEQRSLIISLLLNSVQESFEEGVDCNDHLNQVVKFFELQDEIFSLNNKFSFLLKLNDDHAINVLLKLEEKESEQMIQLAIHNFPDNKVKWLQHNVKTAAALLVHCCPKEKSEQWIRCILKDKKINHEELLIELAKFSKGRIVINSYLIPSISIEDLSCIYGYKKISSDNVSQLLCMMDPSVAGRCLLQIDPLAKRMEIARSCGQSLPSIVVTLSQEQSSGIIDLLGSDYFQALFLNFDINNIQGEISHYLALIKLIPVIEAEKLVEVIKNQCVTLPNPQLLATLLLKINSKRFAAAIIKLTPQNEIQMHKCMKIIGTERIIKVILDQKEIETRVGVNLLKSIPPQQSSSVLIEVHKAYVEKKNVAVISCLLSDGELSEHIGEQATKVLKYLLENGYVNAVSFWSEVLPEETVISAVAEQLTLKSKHLLTYSTFLAEFKTGLKKQRWKKIVVGAVEQSSVAVRTLIFQHGSYKLCLELARKMDASKTIEVFKTDGVAQDVIDKLSPKDAEDVTLSIDPTLAKSSPTKQKQISFHPLSILLLKAPAELLCWCIKNTELDTSDWINALPNQKLLRESLLFCVLKSYEDNGTLCLMNDRNDTRRDAEYRLSDVFKTLSSTKTEMWLSAMNPKRRAEALLLLTPETATEMIFKFGRDELVQMLDTPSGGELISYIEPEAPLMAVNECIELVGDEFLIEGKQIERKESPSKLMLKQRRVSISDTVRETLEKGSPQRVSFVRTLSKNKSEPSESTMQSKTLMASLMEKTTPEDACHILKRMDSRVANDVLTQMAQECAIGIAKALMNQYYADMSAPQILDLSQRVSAEILVSVIFPNKNDLSEIANVVGTLLDPKIISTGDDSVLEDNLRGIETVIEIIEFLTLHESVELIRALPIFADMILPLCPDSMAVTAEFDQSMWEMLANVLEQAEYKNIIEVSVKGMP
ncbi:hypothetical protein D5R81_16290 [Parashewanella spongiae]|uniref:Uncharacterized protein n=1 Tax=Parashewanella spongiae TaxID=342950 RepID=A0A3A6TC20_9GAMM|nr:hypothetical protein [Parashewanella spongiae]MCL1079642.1 hypothetical protein [Parashewanella spongiae]RJY07230.1 hypothetical protein D5R81_16290 [Parashewanella spongiae]